MVEWVNLTGHIVRVYDESGKKLLMELYPAGKTVRVVSKIIGRKTVGGIPVVKDVYTEVINLPAPKPGVMYIVSTPVLEYLKEMGIYRPDVVAPDTGQDSVVYRKVKGGYKKIGVRRFRGWW